MTCELCAYEFVPDESCHTGCPMSSGCTLICCPNCGYQAVDQERSILARTIERLFPGRREPRRTPAPSDAGGAVPLSHLPKGAVGEVRSLNGMPEGRLTRLSAFGLVPGTPVTIKQRRPVPVIGIGETEVAVSEDVLGQIWVAPGDG